MVVVFSAVFQVDLVWPCPAREVAASKCPSRYHLPTAGANDPSLPPIWTYCPIATIGDAGGTANPSPGVAAFVPGAALAVALPTGWLKKSGGMSATTAFNVGVRLSDELMTSGVKCPG